MRSVDFSWGVSAQEKVSTLKYFTEPITDKRNNKEI